MKRYLIPLLAMLVAVSCNNKPHAVVNLDLKEATEVKVGLYKMGIDSRTLVDSLTTDKKGHLRHTIDLPDAGNPAFYNYYYHDRKIAGIVAADKDRISITADTLGHYTVEGSDDSRLLKQMDSLLTANIARMEAVLEEAPADENIRLSRIYIEHKRAMLRQIMENPLSITSAAALFQKFNNNLYVFQEPTDVYVFEKIRDTLATVYPGNDYVNAVSQAIEARHNADMMNEMLNAADYGIPEIKMTDFYGKEHSLSELKGKVIMLSFWSTAQEEHKIFNQEMVPVYDKYHDRGFEIFQVCVDSDKPVWASVVRSQNLPWICVNDGLGLQSPAVAAYNLNSIPTLFIISRDSDIIAQDVYDPAEIDRIIAANI